MTSSSEPQRVRPWLLHGSVVLFVVLIPIAALAVWDYVEARRLESLVQTQALRGDPIALPGSIVPRGGPSDAERFYRAASALTKPSPGGVPGSVSGNQFWIRVSRSQHDDVWPADVVEGLRGFVSDNDEAMAFADRAADRPFQPPAPGSYGASIFYSGNLFGQRALTVRAVVRALDGDGDAAVASLYSAVRSARTLSLGFGVGSLDQPLRIVLDHTRPSSAALERLGRALAETDQDDDLLQQLRRARALTFDRRPTTSIDWIVRPWTTHRLLSAFPTMTMMIEAAQRPWPARIDAPILGPWLSWPWLPLSSGPFGSSDPQRYYRLMADSTATRVAVLRAVRMAVAAEQYRREHGEALPEAVENLTPRYLAALPVDPFSGRAMIFKKDGTGYAVYSVGSNRKDDGARELGQDSSGVTVGPRTILTSDIGLRLAPR